MNHPLTRATCCFMLALALIQAPVMDPAFGMSSRPQEIHDEPGSILGLKVTEQINDISCGIACLSSVMAYWDTPVEQEDLLKRFPPLRQNQGYSLGELKAIAQSAGLSGFALRGDLEVLQEHVRKGRPVIVAIEVPYNLYSFGAIRNIPGIGNLFSALSATTTFSHFVVICSTEQDNVWVMDPLSGIRSMPTTQFETFWEKKHRAMLLVAS